MAVRGLGDALMVLGQGVQQKAQADWQEQRQANLERIRREERTADQSIRANERKEDSDYRDKRNAVEDAYRDKTLKMQQDNINADNASRNVQLGIAREGLNLQQDNSEFSRVEQAYAGAMAGVANISQRMAEVEKMQPKINSDGTTEDITAFNDRKKETLATLEDRLESERIRAKSQVDQLHAQFPQYKKYFVQQKQEPVQPLETIQQPLLRRPTQ